MTGVVLAGVGNAEKGAGVLEEVYPETGVWGMLSPSVDAAGVVGEIDCGLICALGMLIVGRTEPLTELDFLLVEHLLVRS